MTAPKPALRAILALAVLAAPFFATPSAAAQDGPGAEIRTLLEDQAAAWNRGDMEAFLSVYHRDPNLTFFSGTSVTRGYEGFAARFRARYAEGEGRMDPLTFSDLEVETLGPDAAFVRGRWRLDAPEGDDPGGLFTLILRRLPEQGWRIVHDHTS